MSTGTQLVKQEVPPLQGLYQFPKFPVVLVTVGGEHDRNIITLHFAHPVSFRPPMLGVGIGIGQYSHSLLKKHGEFVVNIPKADLRPAIDFCGAHSGRHVDKFKETGLTPVRASRVNAYLIGECPVNTECRVVQTVDLGTHTWFFGEVLTVHLLGTPLEGYDRTENEAFAYL
jgi:flavin reductase (DIM6/NTAB) family NADH-FMN oxidoreductase RutF